MTVLILSASYQTQSDTKSSEFWFQPAHTRQEQHNLIRRESVANTKRQELREIAARDQSNGLSCVKHCPLEGCKCFGAKHYFEMSNFVP